MKKIISVLMCLVMLFSLFTTIASAEENYEPAPCFNNTSSAALVFTVEDGEAGATIYFNGYTGLCTGGTVTTKIQKRYLWVFWKDIDNAEWVDEVNDDSFFTYHSVNVSDKGTYKATVEFVIRGTGGSDDVFEIEREYKYE